MLGSDSHLASVWVLSSFDNSYQPPDPTHSCWNLKPQALKLIHARSTGLFDTIWFMQRDSAQADPRTAGRDIQSLGVSQCLGTAHAFGETAVLHHVSMYNKYCAESEHIHGLGMRIFG